ncbi:apoptosis-inducing factor 2-like [Chenopodium quinoa]|uniref:FAD/NAD(P)-binding domain-containing protein n=1 Tax=Chenopodium quinoa TaxID=63459 RepID=A0A803MUA9_CHEQI|nr:apoptosis-inducing factor 2-like [Chenopodium quinoa]XP_021725188.1 apoptosis-inducing factor 2-like [Chenopodium quinoa]
MHSKSPKNVVVVGGGIAGALLAKNLQDHANVTLIDPKEYFEIIWASLRSMVDLSFAERSLVNYSDFLSQVKLITSYATHITESEVLTARGDRVPYDYLVIATGHVYSDPVTRAEGLSKYQEELNKIKSSSSIMIIGGGPSGVELAGEIVNEFPDKKITLVHRGPRLLQFIGSKASQKALEWLTSKKVEVILDQSVDLTPTSEGAYQTSGGETIVADQYFSCTGSQSGSSWLKDTILMDNLDMKGKLVVDKHLRVEGHRSIFAIGDITNLPELKQGYLAMRHAELTAKNLRLLLGGGSEEKMTVYKPGRPIAFVSLGKKDAVAEINGFTMSGCFPGLIKSGDLFVGKTRKTYGLNS